MSSRTSFIYFWQIVCLSFKLCIFLANLSFTLSSCTLWLYIVTSFFRILSRTGLDFPELEMFLKMEFIWELMVLSSSYLLLIDVLWPLHSFEVVRSLSLIKLRSNLLSFYPISLIYNRLLFPSEPAVDYLDMTVAYFLLKSTFLSYSCCTSSILMRTSSWLKFATSVVNSLMVNDIGLSTNNNRYLTTIKYRNIWIKIYFNDCCKVYCENKIKITSTHIFIWDKILFISVCWLEFSIRVYKSVIAFAIL